MRPTNFPVKSQPQKGTARRAPTMNLAIMAVKLKINGKPGVIFFLLLL